MLFDIGDDLAYQLRAVIVHGGNAGGGHYVAYVRAADEMWHHYNDTAPPRRVADPRQVLRAQAYMLFYER